MFGTLQANFNILTIEYKNFPSSYIYLPILFLSESGMGLVALGVEGSSTMKNYEIKFRLARNKSERSIWSCMDHRYRTR